MMQTGRAVAVGLFLLWLPAAIGQSVVSEIKLHTDPADAKVRPLEPIVVQLLAYSDIDDGNGGTKKVRVQPTSQIQFSLADSNAGWLSKPFRFQGDETEGFYRPQGTGLASIIFQQATSQYVLQDSTLYTAPDKTGSYEVKAELDGKTASIKISVDAGAPSHVPAEKTQFPAEPASHDPYRPLAEHYAPYIAQETWFTPKADYLARFDFDGDWHGDDNWDDAETGSSQAYVHYAAIESDTHWFLIYNFFHPRDYSDKCVVGTCHENDNEGMILTIEKDGSQFGKLLAMETLAHNNIYSHRADSRVEGGIHNIDGEIEMYQGSHPVVFIESGGHGVYGSLAAHAAYTLKSGKFTGGTGVTYFYKGKAERPKYANDHDIGYELLPIYENWWLRANSEQGRSDHMFDEYYQYVPYGGRPGTPEREIAGSFYGRMKASNKAKPFWGWFDNRTLKQKAVATGQWGLDPAYSVSQDLRMPQPFSLHYVFNPYLGIGQPSTSPVSQGQPAAEPSASTGGLDVALSEFRPKRSSDYDANARRGEFNLRFYVDMTMELYVQGDTVRYRFEGQRPRDDGSEYSQPIPRAVFSRFDLEQKDGRGEIVLLEKPTPDNDYTAKLRITDSKGGEDRYHARLSWEWTAAAPATGSAAAGPAGAAGSAGVAGSGSPAASNGSATVGSASGGSAQAPARSSVLSRHIDDLLNGAAGNAGGAAPPAGVELFSKDNNPASYNDSSSGLFEFRGRVDGEVLFRIRGDRVFADNTNGRPAEVESFTFSQPLPAIAVGEMSVEQRDGRGEVVLVEQPSAGNDFTATVRVSDPKGGDDRYHFRLQWRR